MSYVLKVYPYTLDYEEKTNHLKIYKKNDLFIEKIGTTSKLHRHKGEFFVLKCPKITSNLFQKNIEKKDIKSFLKTIDEEFPVSLSKNWHKNLYFDPLFYGKKHLSHSERKQIKKDEYYSDHFYFFKVTKTSFLFCQKIVKNPFIFRDSEIPSILSAKSKIYSTKIIKKINITPEDVQKLIEEENKTFKKNEIPYKYILFEKLIQTSKKMKRYDIPKHKKDFPDFTIKKIDNIELNILLMIHCVYNKEKKLILGIKNKTDYTIIGPGSTTDKAIEKINIFLENLDKQGIDCGMWKHYIHHYPNSEFFKVQNYVELKNEATAHDIIYYKKTLKSLGLYE